MHGECVPHALQDVCCRSALCPAVLLAGPRHTQICNWVQLRTAADLLIQHDLSKQS